MEINTIIFDMDGTLYEFNDGSFIKSGVYAEMIKNTIHYISKNLNISQQQAADRLGSIRETYGNEISFGIENELKLDRFDYFNFAWDIAPGKYLRHEAKLADMLSRLAQKYQLVVLTDAPMVWAKKVLTHLGLADIFKSNVYTGETNIRKSNGTAHSQLLAKLNLKPENCMFVGDEVKNDLMPAKMLGMTTVLMSAQLVKDPCVDHRISSILELADIF